ncbi:hypothetical protein J1605_014810 [Eschrichtius robustus]|nr:hypothetical protein J1605_014810 [Eschrichtius robustus]
MAAAEPAVPALPSGGGAGAPSGTVPVLFCFSVFARPAAVPHGAGYELLIQKFLSLYGDQIDMHRKFVVQLFAEEWGQYVDLPKGFAVSERCKVRLVPLQIQVGPAGGPRAEPQLPVPVRPRPRPRGAPQVPRGGGPCAPHPLGRAVPLSEASGMAQRRRLSEGDGQRLSSAEDGAWASRLLAARANAPTCVVLSRRHPLCVPGASPSLLRNRRALTTLGNLTPSSTVFFCCDMQERFRPAIKYFGDIISVGQRLLQGARILGIPVIVTEQYPKGLGSTVQEIDLTGVKLVLPKTKFSMVLPEVEAALAEIPGVRSVVLFGVETHVCIQQTALELVGRGIEVHIVADATSSRSMMDRMFALERLARTGIIVTTSEAVLLQLVADKDHPKFKEIQNLIKASAPESGLLSKV